MNDNFYCLYCTTSQRRLATWVDDEVQLEQITCYVNSNHRRVGPRRKPLSILLPRLSVEDFVWTWYSDLLIQEHVLEFLEEHSLSGYTTRLAKCGFKGKKSTASPPSLFEFRVTGWGGMAARESGIRLIKSCESCGLLRYSAASGPERLIDSSQWDGSDFFMVWPLPRYIFMTEKAASLLRFARFKGIVILPVWKLDLGDTGFSPGRLSYWMEPERARLLGGPLGID